MAYGRPKSLRIFAIFNVMRRRSRESVGWTLWNPSRIHHRPGRFVACCHPDSAAAGNSFSSTAVGSACAASAVPTPREAAGFKLVRRDAMTKDGGGVRGAYAIRVPGRFLGT